MRNNVVRQTRRNYYSPDKNMKTVKVTSSTFRELCIVFDTAGALNCTDVCGSKLYTTQVTVNFVISINF
jgi:hypothetical protein